MTSKKSLNHKEIDDYLNQLIYFGGNLGIRPTIKEYVDIESFIVRSTLFMDIDTRTNQTILNWIYLFAPYFSPSKLRRVLKSENFNQKHLSSIISLIESHPLNSQNWSLLEPFRTKKKTVLKPNSQKYLKTSTFIIKNCAELRYRIEGNNQVLADLKAYLYKNKDFQSLYKIAKETFNPRNRINYEYRLIQYI